MVLCWFLPNINMNQPHVASLLNLLPSPPHPIPLGGHRALGCTSCVTQQIPTGYLSITCGNIHMFPCYSLDLSHPPLLPPIAVFTARHKDTSFWRI